jgi:hypothetical protein
MRIDREAFLLAVSALAGCERADSSQAHPAQLAPTTNVEAQRPLMAMISRELTPELRPSPSESAPAPEPVADVVPTPIDHVEPAPAPKPKRVGRPLSVAKRWFLGLSVEQRSNVRSLCEARIANPCAGMLARLMPRPVDADGQQPRQEPEDPEEKYLVGMSTPQRRQASRYCQEQTKMPAPTCETPLVVALDNQPIDFVAAGGERFAFVPGEPMATDWPTAATPWIARDLDGDGEITSGAELFGSSTALANGATARNGFEALAAFDANVDGTLDAHDPMFAELVLWSDRNGDHHSTPDELRPLATVVTAIPLAYTFDARCTARDNCEGERGTLHWRDAAGAEHVGAVVDVYVRRR